MVEIGTQTNPTAKLSAKDFPEKSLGHLFPDFESFYKQLKPNLGFVIINIIKKVDENGKTTDVVDWDKTWAGGLTSGHGILDRFILKNFYLKYRSKVYVGEERDFVDEFLAELAFIVAEIRRKEHVWIQLFREVDKIAKIDRTETERITGTDKSGKTTTGDKDNYQVLSKELTSKTNQLGKVSAFDQKGSTIITAHKGVNYANLGRIINSLSNLQIDFSSFYSRFDRLWDNYCAPTLEFVIDKTTGRGKWVTEEEYIEIVEPDKKPPKKLGPDAFAVLDEYQKTKNWAKYLEALAIYHDQNEKEHDKLPETSNRKPRIANRVKIGEGLKKAYEKCNPLPTVKVFRERVAGKIEIENPGTPQERTIVYDKIIGHENIIKIVENYLYGWEYSVKFDDEPPAQLMLALLGPPGLGKSFIAAQIAKALGRKYVPISLNGKKDADVIYGTNMANPGSDPGEITKAISRSQDQTCLILLDEIEKAGREAKLAIGNPTDREQNWVFKDVFYDFPSPCSNVIFFAALNYQEELPDFVGDRFTKLNVKIYNYAQRIEVARGLIHKAFKKMEKAFMQCYHKTADQIFDLFNQEALIKKTLTWTFSVRGMGKNIFQSLIPTIKADFLMQDKPLPNDLVNYNWNFSSREDTEEIDKGDKDRKRMPCPYSQDKNLPHRKAADKTDPGFNPQKCVCFVNNLDQVPGWKENIGSN